MSEKKKFKCETCGYILEHDGIAVLPVCPECGDADNWVAVASEPTNDAPKSKRPQENGFEQIIGNDLGVSGDAAVAGVSGLFVEMSTSKPADSAEIKKHPSTHPFAMPAETGFELVTPTDFTSGDVSSATIKSIRGPEGNDKSDGKAFAQPAETGFEQFIPTDINVSSPSLNIGGTGGPQSSEAKTQPSTHPFDMPKETGFGGRDFSDHGAAVEDLKKQVGEPTGKLDEYAFKMPRDTGFEQILPNDFTQGDTSKAAIASIIGPAQTAADLKKTQPFAMPKETGFEQITPTDFTQGDTSKAAIASIIGPSDREVNAPHQSTHPFAKSEETGFEQFIPKDITEDVGSLSIASIRPVKDSQSKTPDVSMFRCSVCGVLVEVLKDGKKFPPCPICGELGEWTPVESKK